MDISSRWNLQHIHLEIQLLVTLERCSLRLTVKQLIYMFTHTHSGCSRLDYLLHRRLCGCVYCIWNLSVSSSKWIKSRQWCYLQIDYIWLKGFCFAVTPDCSPLPNATFSLLLQTNCWCSFRWRHRRDAWTHVPRTTLATPLRNKDDIFSYSYGSKILMFAEMLHSWLS